MYDRDTPTIRHEFSHKSGANSIILVPVSAEKEEIDSLIEYLKVVKGMVKGEKHTEETHDQ